MGYLTILSPGKEEVTKAAVEKIGSKEAAITSAMASIFPVRHTRIKKEAAIRKEVGRTKEVLGANMETMISIEDPNNVDTF